jgi:hypothetical protein
MISQGPNTRKENILSQEQLELIQAQRKQEAIQAGVPPEQYRHLLRESRAKQQAAQNNLFSQLIFIIAKANALDHLNQNTTMITNACTNVLNSSVGMLEIVYLRLCTHCLQNLIPPNTKEHARFLVVCLLVLQLFYSN